MMPLAPAVAVLLWSALPIVQPQPYTLPRSAPVQVEVLVDGSRAPLFSAPDGSGRLYLEARSGSTYDVVLRNQSPERVGIVLVVDGLNVISGERAEAGSPHNRMYVLDPWDTTTVRGWRSSLDEVRRFTFVDERASYAARSRKANRKMGWIEAGVYREQGRWAKLRPAEPWNERDQGSSTEQEARKSAAPTAPPPAAAAEGRAQAHAESQDRADAPELSGGARSYPGTGWGDRTHDPVRIVEFEPMPTPAQLVTLRYEYAPALRALGVLPPFEPRRDRLHQREHAEEGGFAKPPVW